MSDDIRREDVIATACATCAQGHQPINGMHKFGRCAAEWVRALSPSPRAAAAQRLARAAEDYHERSAITGHTPGHLAAEDELQEALAAWRESEGSEA